MRTEHSDVWYRRAGTPSKTPVLCVHGGPGLPSDYLCDLEALGNEREIIFYDQGGCGRSRADPRAPHTLERYVRELSAVRDALTPGEVVLYGHSWGGLVAAEYLARAPRHVKAAVLASPMVSTEQWTTDIATNIRTLPRKLADALISGKPRRLAERAEQQFFDKYNPHREHPGYERAHKRTDPAVRRALWGESVFSCTGALRGHDVRMALAHVHVPTLITTGTFDGVLPVTAQDLAESMLRGEIATFRGAGHYAHIDYPKRYAARVRHFLHEHDI